MSGGQAPAKPRRHSAQGEDRKAMLLRHAEELFAEQGFAKTRMADIARHAGVAKGLVYWYFESKEALVHAVILDLRRRLRSAQMAAIRDLEPLAGIYVGTVVAVRFIAEHHRLYGLLNNVVGAPLLATAVAESVQAHADDAARALREAQEAGAVRRDESPQIMAVGNSGVVNNAVLMLVTGLLPGTVDEVAHGAGRYVLHAVAADPTLVEAVLAEHGPAAAPATP
jgi:AcrR family transcriptional regulator